MRKWIARFLLTRFSRRYDYDTTYMETMLEQTPAAFFQFAKIMGVAAHRRVAPKEAYYAVKIVAAASEDCGPCTQLCVAMASEAKVSPRQIEAVLSQRTEEMEVGTLLGFRFAQAMADESSELDAARDAVRDAWGEPAMIELSLCFAVSRVFPAIKKGMGFAHECRVVTVEDRPVQVVRHAA